MKLEIPMPAVFVFDPILVPIAGWSAPCYSRATCPHVTRVAAYAQLSMAAAAVAAAAMAVAPDTGRVATPIGLP